MDINQMTYAVQGALQKAVELAKENENQNIEIEAVLKAALEENESLFKSVLERANINTEQLVNAYNEKLKNYPSVQGENIQYGQYISPKANELLN
ncbi:MAG: Clp protease N-terminal domain-containing protein, partial [Staphylococcus equorum]|nr:Clp protease N-terminal domain-containing protein [Staphylococcus equorum]